MLNAPRRCLIADDVRASRELIRHWLSEFGFECDLASDGEAAWESLQTARPDLIITDIEMSNCSGLELLQRIRHDPSPKVRAIPVLVMTSLHDCEMDRTVKRFGGNGVLYKPLDKSATFLAVFEVIADGGEEGSFIGSSGGENEQGSGVISPTLRRLVSELAETETRQEDS